jgi:hypothetical protein
MKPVNARRERGAALLALLAVIMLGASWFLVSQLNAESGMADAVRKTRNAEVLQRAKQALIGYIAAQAAKAFEDRPGALPCPEAAGYFDSTTDDGKAASSCTLPKVGRFPWRTIGTERLTDASGEPLWYVVSPGWAYTSGTGPVINSNSVGQLTVDGTATTPVASPGVVNVPGHGFSAGDSVSFTTGGTLPTGITAGTPYYVIAAGLSTNEFRIAATAGGSAINFTGTTTGTHNVHRNPPGAANSVVALIIAPGPAFNVASSTGCAAKSQARPTTGTPDWSNYLECENATYPTPDATFVTTGPSSSFNDQVIKITVADIMPGIEAAIAHRIEREILPALKTVYTPSAWGFVGTSPVTANPVLPYAAPFGNPGSGTGTANYQGAAATYAGLLPFNQTQGCTVSASDPRCTNSFLSWSSSGPVYVSGGGSLRSGEPSFPNTCSWKSTDVYSCVGAYNAPTVTLNLTVTVTNVAMGLRKIDLSKLSFTAANDVACSPCTGTTSIPYTVSVTMNADGSATINIAGTALPDIAGAGWGTWASYTISFDRGFIGDHDLLSTTHGTTGWFARNEWFRFAYYAVSPSNTVVQLPAERSCTAAGNCLTVANMTPTLKSAALILGGRAINGRARPSATLADYFEFGNSNGAYERQTVSPVAATLHADTGTANAYAVAVSSLATGATLQFSAANANTGTSTLTTAATGTRNLVNLDGSNLAAGTIQANAAVQVTWDGTRFLLSKRPFNDRVVAISSN